MPVDDWMPEIKTNVQAVHTAALAAKVIPAAGEIYGYNEWPATLFMLPATVIGTLGGTQDYSLAGPLIAIHNIILRTYFNQGISLSEAQAMAFPFIELMRNQFAQDIRLNNKCDFILPVSPPALFYDGPGVLQYAGKDHAGLVFNYVLKETETFTVQA